MSLRAEVEVVRDGFAVEAAFRVEPGTTAALLGPNGAGKTTLLRALAGLEPVRRATIVLDERVLDDTSTRTHLPPAARAIGLVPQDLHLFPHLTALENVAFPLRAKGMRRSPARRRAVAALERLGLAGRADARPRELSGGEAQRVALARALVHEPRLLLLDEPLSALDAQARPSVRALLRQALSAFDGVRILVTHDPVEAMTLADDIIVMESGRITQTGSPHQIRSAPRTPYAATLVGLNLFRGRLEPLEPGVARLRTDDGDLVVASSGDEETDVLGLLRPGDVSLYRGRPESSARNVVEGRISSLTREMDRVRISIDSRPPLVAEVTPASVERLGLEEGVTVWASFKAMEVTLVPA
jgi:molybdate transport system ATP-binding protein